MIKALLDINLLMDFLKLREEHEKAAQIINLASRNEFKAYASAHEMTTLAYFLEKDERTPGEFRRTLSMLFGLIQILPVDQEILQKALHSEIRDYEDAVLEAVSLKNGVEFIVTRNVKDFKNSRVKAVSPASFLGLLRDQSSDGLSVRERKPSYKTGSPKRQTKK